MLNSQCTGEAIPHLYLELSAVVCMDTSRYDEEMNF